MRPQPLAATLRPDLFIDRAKGVARPPVPIEQTGPVDWSLLQQVFGQTVTPGNYVTPTETNVGGLPALERGVDLVAHAVATMMKSADVLDSTGAPIEGPRPNIVHRPATLLGSYEFYRQAVTVAMKRGNFIGVLTDWDLDGYARQVVPVHPDMVTLDVHSQPGIPLYRIGGAVYSWQEVVHVRNHAPSGTMWGLGIVERFRRHLELQLYEAEYARNSFRTGGVPSIWVRLDEKEPTQQQVTTVKEGWMDTFGGGSREPAVSGNRILDVKPLSWSPKDADWVNGAQLSIAQCAYMAGLRPEDLGAAAGGGAGMNYGNRTDDALQRITDSYGQWLNLFEDAWTDLLPVGLQVRANVEALLRTSTKERYEIHGLAQSIGLQTQAETRVIEHRPADPTTEEVTAP